MRNNGVFIMATHTHTWLCQRPSPVLLCLSSASALVRVPTDGDLAAEFHVAASKNHLPSSFFLLCIVASQVHNNRRDESAPSSSAARTVAQKDACNPGEEVEVQVEHCKP